MASYEKVKYFISLSTHFIVLSDHHDLWSSFQNLYLNSSKVARSMMSNTKPMIGREGKADAARNPSSRHKMSVPRHQTRVVPCSF